MLTGVGRGGGDFPASQYRKWWKSPGVAKGKVLFGWRSRDRSKFVHYGVGVGELGCKDADRLLMGCTGVCVCVCAHRRGEF